MKRKYGLSEEATRVLCQKRIFHSHHIVWCICSVSSNSGWNTLFRVCCVNNRITHGSIHANAHARESVSQRFGGEQIHRFQLFFHFTSVFTESHFHFYDCFLGKSCRASNWFAWCWCHWAAPINRNDRITYCWNVANSITSCCGRKIHKFMRWFVVILSVFYHDPLITYPFAMTHLLSQRISKPIGAICAPSAQRNEIIFYTSKRRQSQRYLNCSEIRVNEWTMRLKEKQLYCCLLFNWRYRYR